MKLKPLPYLLKREGEVVRVCYAPDPRIATVESFKRIDSGFEAYPVDDKTAKRWERKLSGRKPKVRKNRKGVKS